MSIRIPTRQSVTVKPSVGRALPGALLNVSFDGAFFVPTDKNPETLLERHTLVRLCGTPTDDTPLDVAARVVEAHKNGVGLKFDGYDEVVNDYLERVYSQRPIPWIPSLCGVEGMSNGSV